MHARISVLRVDMHRLTQRDHSLYPSPPWSSFTSSPCGGRPRRSSRATAAAGLWVTRVSSSTSTSLRSIGARTAVYHLYVFDVQHPLIARKQRPLTVRRRTNITASSSRASRLPLSHSTRPATRLSSHLRTSQARPDRLSLIKATPACHWSRDKAELCHTEHFVQYFEHFQIQELLLGTS